MNAIITAGGKPLPGESLFTVTRGEYKAFIDIGGKPMVQWTLDAVASCDQVEHIAVVGLPLDTVLACKKPIHLVEDQGDLIANIRASVHALDRIDPHNSLSLLISGDAPGINSEMLDWLISTVSKNPHEFTYLVVERKNMEARYPQSRRTYTRFKDVEICGGDVMVINKSLAMRPIPALDQLVSERKNPIRQARIIGLGTLFLVLIRHLTLHQTAQRACKRLGIDGDVMITPYPEMGMDVDKLNQLEIIRQDLGNPPT